MRTVQDQKMLGAMADPEGREVVLDMLRHRLSGGKFVSRERLEECAAHSAFEAFLDFEFTVSFDAEISS